MNRNFDIRDHRSQELRSLIDTEARHRHGSPKGRKQYAISIILVALMLGGIGHFVMNFGNNSSASSTRTEIPRDAITDPYAILGDWYMYATGDFRYTFHADGTGVHQYPFDDEPVDITWEIDDDVLTILRHSELATPIRWNFGVLDDVLYLRGIGLQQSPRFIRNN